jgi:hypothetical protein
MASVRSSSVATDQKSGTVEIEPGLPGSVIENELPTYRAISLQAIFSLVFGVLALCTFAHPLFYAASILAVVLGFLARRTIRQYPDMLTGEGLANAGIALGLVFGLVTGTYTAVQTYVRSRQAEQFARHIAQVLEAPTIAEIISYNVHPSMRSDPKHVEEVLKKLDSPTPKDKMLVDQKYGQLLALKRRLQASKNEHIEFVRIEGMGDDESHGSPTIPLYAFALYEVHGPGNKEFPEQQQYALAILKATITGKKYEWWLEDVRFPYTPKSYVAATKPVDDGHGHAH